MSEAWQAAQDRMRQRIWDARRDEEQEGTETPSPTPLHPPELVYPAIVSPRPLLGQPTRVIKRVLHRLLQPLVFGPQSDFNDAVAAQLSDIGRWSEAVGSQLRELQDWSEAVGSQLRELQDLNAIAEANHRRLDEVAQALEALRGDVLAARGELQSQLVVVEKLRRAGGEDEGPTEARQVDSA